WNHCERTLEAFDTSRNQCFPSFKYVKDAMREESSSEENQIIAERRAKLAELRKRGIAFPNDFRREYLAGDLHKAWGGKSNEEIEPKAVKQTVAGHMML